MLADSAEGDVANTNRLWLMSVSRTVSFKTVRALDQLVDRFLHGILQNA